MEDNLPLRHEVGEGYEEYPMDGYSQRDYAVSGYAPPVGANFPGVQSGSRIYHN